MTRQSFETATGREISAVTAAEMRAVDRVAVEGIGLQLMQMMENAGRALAWHVRDLHTGSVAVVAGNGGNGGGGMVCARHLANRGVPVQVVLDRTPDELTGAAAHQHRILAEMSVPVTTSEPSLETVADSVVVDALIGYGLSGTVRPPASTLIESMNDHSARVLSLDVPSGTDATTGEPLGATVTPDRTVTLALPKTGLIGVGGEVFVADIGIPATVYERLDIAYDCPFDDHDWLRLEG
ncbi:NAD(P)H-hydrate epimerase [Salinigranum marinum]|uniref:NAD(P)H-hydrate epimerase n=1 Tax=Salinigranum marinum TaxID=1515595 RepID=UPI002989CCA7|nr:NAD(P)H-hydrate epimerase [Salinigranum marinum]